MASEIEDFAEEASFPAVFVLVMAKIFAISMVIVVMPVLIRRYVPAIGQFGERALNDFLQFAPVEPYATAFRTVINFHALPLGHQ